MNKFDLFPPVYKQNLEKQKNEVLYSIESAKSNETQKLNQKRISSKANGVAIRICGGLGLLVAIVFLFMSCGNCFSFLCSHQISTANAVETNLGFAVMALAIGAGIGGLIELFIFILRKSKDTNIDKKVQNTNDIAPVHKEQVTIEYENKYKTYAIEFENEAKRQSIKFAESQLAKEVITWMTNGFCSAIDATDRRPHIQEIDVPFVFNVYYNKITCNIGTYDFELKRCANLTSVMDQAALTRAIASAIQLNVVMKYPKDISGESINVNIEYTYTKDSAVATLRYTAYNGNYRPTMSWDQ